MVMLFYRTTLLFRYCLSDEMESLIDQDLLVEKCNILLARDRIPEFYDSALQLFSRHCPDIRDDDEVHGNGG
jgi:hypothetical protein